MKFGRHADLGREADHHVVQDALGGMAAFQLHHRHRPAVGNHETQRRFGSGDVQAYPQQCPQGKTHKRSGTS